MGTSDNHSWSAVSVTPASAIEIEKTFNSFNREHEGTITGHSLGGTLGTIAAFAISTEAIAFNPAAIHNNTIRTKNRLTSS